MKTLPPPKTPTVAIARVLRDLGLTQGPGNDFRMEGAYRNGERIGTYVLVLGRHAEEVIAEHADAIEAQAGAAGYAFRVSVHYPNGDRPMTNVANYGPRVRDTPPAAAAPAAAPSAAPAPAAAKPEPAPAPPPVGSTATRSVEGARERARQKQQAHGLGWSARQADLMAAAAAVQLRFDHHGVLRHYPRPGWAGQAVDEGRLAPLVKAGFLTVTEPFGAGHKRVSVTADGRAALLLWRRWRPAPVNKDRKEERVSLRPLLGGEEADRRGRAAAEDERKRKAEADAMFAALDALHAWEERDERLWKVWARVQGITYRLGRPVPAGWIPTEEEIDHHRLDPAAVAELRAEAAQPTPKPVVPWLSPLRAVELPPLPAAPDEAEQLSLFGEAA
jgi:DNA-binding PadR family transcriptional regulator